MSQGRGSGLGIIEGFSCPGVFFFCFSLKEGGNLTPQSLVKAVWGSDPLKPPVSLAQAFCERDLGFVRLGLPPGPGGVVVVRLSITLVERRWVRSLMR